MIEVLGFRHAAGKPTARVAMAAAAAFALTYFAYGVQIATAGLGLPSEVSVAANVITVMLYMLAVLLCEFVLVILSDTDKQQVAPPTAIPDETKLHRWWTTSAQAAWLRQPALWLVVLTPVGIDLARRGATLGGPAHAALEAAVLALMIWHLRFAARLARTMWRTAKLGDGQPYWGFDWNDTDVSDDARFNERFRARVWKPPHHITHPVEADRYSQRARSRRLLTLTATAGTTLLSAVWAQRVVINTWRDLTHLAGRSGHDPSIGHVFLWCAALASFMIPVMLQQRATELDALAKLYDEQSTDLRNAGKEVFRAPSPDLMSWAPASRETAEAGVDAVASRPAA